jgi:hypothetical protein
VPAFRPASQPDSPGSKSASADDNLSAADKQNPSTRPEGLGQDDNPKEERLKASSTRIELPQRQSRFPTNIAKVETVVLACSIAPTHKLQKFTGRRDAPFLFCLR